MSSCARMLEPLNAVFGDDTFFWESTGGGCTALVGELPNDLAVYITDSTDSTHGEEAFITPSGERDAQGGDANFGFTVGLYTDEHSTPLDQGHHPTAPSYMLPALVLSLLIEDAIKRWANEL
jgi:hypothetical protein